MNKLTIIGNLTRDPELRTTQTGLNVCSFTVAVNSRRKDADGNDQAEFFRVTAWRQMAEICNQYLAKGRKVAVVGPVSIQSYEAKDGGTRYSLEVTAEDVEFLSPKDEGQAAEPKPASKPTPKPAPAAPKDAEVPFADAGYTEVDEEALPF